MTTIAGRRTLANIKFSGVTSFSSTKTTRVNLDFGGKVLIVGENNDTPAATSNGSGKSNLLKTIAWGLYGKQALSHGTKASDIIHTDGASAFVHAVIDVETIRFLLVRHRSKSGATLRVYQLTKDLDDVDVSEVGYDPFDFGHYGEVTPKGVREAQDFIETTILGMDWDTFRCTTFFGQGDMFRFASPHLKDADRKKLFSSIVGLEVWDNVRACAKETADLLKSEVQAIQEALRVAMTVRTRVERKEAYVQGKIDALEGQHLVRSSVIEKLETQIHSVEEDRQKSEEAVLEAIAWRDQSKANVSSARSLGRRLGDAAAEAKAAYDTVKQRFDALEHEDSCPLCLQQIKEDASVKGVLQREYVESQARYFEAQELCAEGREDLEDLEHLCVSATKDLAIPCAALSKKEKVLSDLKGRLETELQAEEDYATQVLKLLEEDTALKAEAAEGEALSAGHEEEQERKEKELCYVQWWAKKGFLTKGVPSLALNRALPLLNQFLAHYLKVLTDGTFMAVWGVTRPNPGSASWSLGCETTIEGQKGCPLSGGQMRKLELATEMALAHLYRVISGNDFSLVCIDEPFAGLDDEGIRRVCLWLDTLPIRTILLISHTDAAKDEFDRVWVVSKTLGRSELQMTS